MKNINKHLFFWTLFFVAVYVIDTVADPDTTFLTELIFFFTQNIFLFYGIFFCLNTFSRKSKLSILFSVLKFVLLFASFIILRYWIRYYVLATFFLKEFGEYPFKYWFPSCFNWIINSFFYALAYFYFRTSLEREKKIFSTEKENLINQKELYRLEKEKIQLENTLLRAQINPHFLFNTLGYFYNEISELHPQVGEGIAALADIMRSAIREPDADGLIALEEEIYNVEQLVGIYKLRYNESVFISFQKDGDSNDMRILPHTLTTLVENGLKHGEIHDADHPFFIRLTITDDRVLFETHNKKRIGPKELSHGIGMKFLRSHLDTVYENCYNLSIHEDATFYTAVLNIAIKDTAAVSMMA